MKFTDYLARMAVEIDVPLSELTELTRKLKEDGSDLEQADGDDFSAKWRAKSGPGGGIEAEPFHAGFLLVALMVNGPRSGAARRTWDAWNMKTAGTKLADYGSRPQFEAPACPLTGQRLLGSAIKAIVSDLELAKRVSRLRVDQDRDFAEIIYDTDQVSRFESLDPNLYRPLRRVAELSGAILVATAVHLKKKS